VDVSLWIDVLTEEGLKVRLFHEGQFGETIKSHAGRLRAELRKAKERTVEATRQRVGATLQDFDLRECSSYFRNAGYGDV
jgi:hypothetical protein